MARNKTIDAMLAASKKLDAQLAGEDGEAQLRAAEAAAAEGLDRPASEELRPEGPPPEPSEPPVKAPAEPVETETPPAAETPPKGDSEPPEAESKPEEKARPSTAFDRAIARERQAIARLKAELAQRNQELAEARRAMSAGTAAVEQPKAVETKAAPDDPEPPKPGQEPDEAQFPLEHEAWERRMIRYENWQTRQLMRQQIEEVRQNIAEITQGTQRHQAALQFDRGLEAAREQYKAVNPEFEEARQFLLDANAHMMRLQGVPEYEIPERLKTLERQTVAQALNRINGEIADGLRAPDTNPIQAVFEELFESAKAYRWTPQAKAAAGAGGGVAAKPVTPAAKLADMRERASAARSSSTMKTEPVSTAGTEPMTAKRFMEELTPVQRQRYKKEHPNWEVELGFIDASDNFIIGSR